jgi:hypothetical protein
MPDLIPRLNHQYYANPTKVYYSKVPGKVKKILAKIEILLWMSTISMMPTKRD